MQPNRISYCTTCKGRLWQLHQTIGINLEQIKLSENIDLVILDYHSEDGLKDYIFKHFSEYLDTQKLKYFRLVNVREQFDMSYAKNVVHKLASGNVLFNLDADNFIGDTASDLMRLKENEIYLPHYLGEGTGRCGRIGIHASQFKKLNGYNESILGLANDDGDFIHRALMQGFTAKHSQDRSIPIENTLFEKQLYAPISKPVYHQRGLVNPQGYGLATVEDHHGQTFNI